MQTHVQRADRTSLHFYCHVINWPIDESSWFAEVLAGSAGLEGMKVDNIVRRLPIAEKPVGKWEIGLKADWTGVKVEVPSRVNSTVFELYGIAQVFSRLPYFAAESD